MPSPGAASRTPPRPAPVLPSVQYDPVLPPPAQYDVLEKRVQKKYSSMTSPVSIQCRPDLILKPVQSPTQESMMTLPPNDRSSWQLEKPPWMMSPTIGEPATQNTAVPFTQPRCGGHASHFESVDQAGIYSDGQPVFCPAQEAGDDDVEEVSTLFQACAQVLSREVMEAEVCRDPATNSPRFQHRDSTNGNEINAKNPAAYHDSLDVKGNRRDRFAEELFVDTQVVRRPSDGMAYLADRINKYAEVSRPDPVSKDSVDGQVSHLSEDYDDQVLRPYDPESYEQALVSPSHHRCDEALKPSDSEHYLEPPMSAIVPQDSDDYHQVSMSFASENCDELLMAQAVDAYDEAAARPSVPVNSYELPPAEAGYGQGPMAYAPDENFDQPQAWLQALEEHQQHVINDNILDQYSEQVLPESYDGALCLSWMTGNGRHPMVTDDEVSYIYDCLKCINNSVATVGLEQLAVSEGLCLAGEVENMDPDHIIRLTLEQMLQTKSRNGTEDIFVTPGGAFSSGYKKKVPLYVFINSAALSQDEMEDTAGKDPTMTVLWDWNVKLQCISQEEY
jgi:hypothetical protein